VAWAEDVQGKIKSVDASGTMVTLDDSFKEFRAAEQVRPPPGGSLASSSRTPA